MILPASEGIHVLKSVLSYHVLNQYRTNDIKGSIVLSVNGGGGGGCNSKKTEKNQKIKPVPNLKFAVAFDFFSFFFSVFFGFFLYFRFFFGIFWFFRFFSVFLWYFFCFFGLNFNKKFQSFEKSSPKFKISVRIFWAATPPPPNNK